MSGGSSVKGLVLAAGLGSRLRPLTDRLAKPLFPFFGPSLLGLALWRLQAHGVNHVAVNTHHLAEQVAAHLGQYSRFFAELKISHERELLGTGGALIPLQGWLGDDHVLIYNGDTISTVDLSAVVKTHLQQQATATMVLLPHHEKGKNPVWTKGDRVVAIGGEEDAVAATFTGIHVVSPKLRQRLPKAVGFHHIIDAYQEALADGERIAIHWHEGLWADLGTPKDYWQTLKHFAHDYTPARDAALGLSACNEWLGKPFSFYFQAKTRGIVPPASVPRTWHIPEGVSVGPFAFLTDTPALSTGGSISQCALLKTSSAHTFGSTKNARLVFDDLVVDVPE